MKTRHWVFAAAIGLPLIFGAPSDQAFAGSAAAADESDPLLSLLGELPASVDEGGKSGGGSVRGKIADNKLAIQAEVLHVVRGDWPRARVRVKVLRKAEQGPGATIDQKQSLDLFPNLGVARGGVDLASDDTWENAVAWNLVKGSKILVELVRPTRKDGQGGAWVANIKLK